MYIYYIEVQETTPRPHSLLYLQKLVIARGKNLNENIFMHEIAIGLFRAVK